MPIFYENVNTTVTSEYRAARNFVYVYPKPNPKTPLGADWKFGPCFLPEKSRHYMDTVENYEVRSDDIWSVTFAKAGSTWTQEMIWLLTNNLDYERAKQSVFERFPYVEFDFIYENVEKNVIDFTNNMTSPRYLKTHLPAGLLPKQLWTVKPKIIYTARGVKDLAISFYHHMVHIQDYKCTLHDFLDAFLENKMFLCPYHSSEKDFWYLRNEENVLFLRYEDMKTDLMGSIEKTVAFLGKEYSEKQLLKLADHLSFDSMKDSSTFNLAKWVGTNTDFREVNGLTKKSEYLFATKFVHAFPVPNPISPLGPNYKFEPCFLPVKCKKYLNQIENFSVLKDDIWGVSFAKTGSTWTQEMIWLMNNDLDYVTAKEKQLFARFPFFEHDIYEDNPTRNTLEMMNRLQSPRHLKTHLPAGLLPKDIWTVKPKIIYTARGVKDTAISYYHHFVYFKEYKGTMQDFLETFLENKILLSPYHGHFKDFWSLRHEENILFLTYEEMKRDLMAVLQKTSKFLGKSYSHEELLKLSKHLSFDTMKMNPSVNFTMTYKKPGNENCDANSYDCKNKFSFIRKGIIGSHKEEMTPELIEKFDTWTREYNLKNGTTIEP